MELILEKLIPVVGSKGWKNPKNKNVKYLNDITNFKNGDPSIILLPKSTEEIVKIMQICSDYSWPITIQGGMTGLVQGAVPFDNEVILSLEKMNSINNLDKVSLTAIVQSGVTLENFQKFLDNENLFFPLDLGSKGSCLIGGNLSTNAGGTRVIKYGMMRALTLGLEVVLADGTVISNLNSLLKDNAGYDLKHLFIGSEGTLGIITKAALKLFPKPKSQNVAFCGLDNFNQLKELLLKCKVELGNDLSAFEVLWKPTYEFIIKSTDIHGPLPENYKYYVLIETLGNKSEMDDEWFKETLSNFLNNKLINDAVIALSKKDINKIWSVRESTSTAFKTIPLRMNFDVSINLNDIEIFIKKLKKELFNLKEVKDVLFFGHLGDNNLHAVVVCNKLHENIKRIFYSIVSEFNGSISAEHGIGLEKKPYLNLSRSYEEIKLMKDLKIKLDPKNILNRNRVIDIKPSLNLNTNNEKINDELKDRFRPEFLSS